MALRQHRGHLMTIQELLTVQRESGPSRCPHCERDSQDHRHDTVEAGLRTRIALLEDRVARLEAWLSTMS
ncbi:MAG: hypothetical protein H7138_03855 [Myxococcales bacterium]|nr:hypothetical protein [Myxococcales bacterium]